jgi:ABC-type uncharacterized transport system substrate-binding protein
VRDMNVGLKRVLKDNFRYQVRWHYMDTKRNPYPEYKEMAGIAARKAIETMQPNVVIAFDDDAQQFVTRHFVNHPNINIVFTGVNNEPEDYGFDKANNVTGLLERLPLAAVRETFLITENFKELGRPLRLGFIGDLSKTTAGDAKLVKNFKWDPIQLVDVKLADTWPEWQANLAELGEKADVILITNYRQIRRTATDKTLVPVKEAVAWIEANSKAPVISANGFFAEEGGMLAIGTSPYQQGEAAASKALEIIRDGKKASDVPITKSTQFIVTMSGAKMKRRNFRLPMVYEAAARADNKYYP